VRLELISSGVGLPRLSKGLITGRGSASEDIRRAFLELPGLTVTDVAKKMLGRGIKISVARINQIRKELAAKGANVVQRKLVRLDSPEAIISRAVYNQGERTTAEVVRELSDKKIIVSEAQLNRLRVKIRTRLEPGSTLARPPMPSKPRKPLPELTASQKRVLAEITPNIGITAAWVAKRYGFSNEFLEDYRIEAMVRAHKVAAAYDPERDVKPATYAVSSLRWLAIDMMRERMRTDLGIGPKEARALFSMLGAITKGEAWEHIPKKYSISETRGQELLDAYRLHKSQLPFETVFSQHR